MLKKKGKIVDRNSGFPIENSQFRSELWISDRKSIILIEIMEIRSEFQPPDRINIAQFLKISIFIKIKLIYLVSDWFRDKIMTYLFN